MATRTTHLIDRDAEMAAYRELDGLAPERSAPLDPSHITDARPIVLRPDGSICDGAHRILGVVAWMRAEGMDPDEDFVEVPALELTREEWETHPSGTDTPDWWVDALERTDDEE